MRKQNWPHILAMEIEAWRNQPFSWGFNDCAMFAANVVEAMTGIDYAAEFRNKYTTREEAQAMLDEHGGLCSIMDKLFDRINPRLAHRGDVVLIEVDSREFLAVVIDWRCAAPGNDGLLFNNVIDVAKIAWRID